MSLNKLVFTVLIIMIQVSCSSNKKQKEISDAVVLKIGSFEITKYEFEQDKEWFKQSQPNVGPKTLKTWLNEYIDRAYLLADAYAKKYDTVKSINKVLTYEFNERLAKVNGYVWEKVEEPKLKVSKPELKEAYKKRDQVYYIEALYFNDSALLNSILKDKKIMNGKNGFNCIKKLCGGDKTKQYYTISDRWPFGFLSPYEEQIYHMDLGEVIGPIYLKNAYHILHLTKKEKSGQLPLNKEKSDIERILRDAKSSRIVNDKQKEIHNKSNMVINEPEVEKLSVNLKANKLKTNELIVDEKLFDDVLMTYSIGGLQKSYTIRDFSDYIQYASLYDDYTEKKIIDCHLKNYVISQYLYRVADSLGILKEKKYLLDRKNFLNYLIEYDYYNNEFKIQVSVDEKKMSDYYEKNKSSYSGGKVSVVSILTFRDKDDAMMNSGIVQQLVFQDKFYYLKDTTVLKGLISYKPNLKIENTSKEYPQELIDKIFSTPEKQVSMPMEYQNNHILFFVTKREGVRIKELKEVQKEIRTILENQKIEQLKSKRILELRKKFPVIINNCAKLI